MVVVFLVDRQKVCFKDKTVVREVEVVASFGEVKKSCIDSCGIGVFQFLCQTKIIFLRKTEVRSLGYCELWRSKEKCLVELV